MATVTASDSEGATSDGDNDGTEAAGHTGDATGHTGDATGHTGDAEGPPSVAEGPPSVAEGPPSVADGDVPPTSSDDWLEYQETLADIADRAGAITVCELETALQSLEREGLDPDQQRTVTTMAVRLANRLLAPPGAALRAAESAGDQRTRRAVEAVFGDAGD